jgi:hypothetical protein
MCCTCAFLMLMGVQCCPPKSASLHVLSGPVTRVSLASGRRLQATRNARRLSVGSVASGVTDQELTDLVNQAMMAAACTVAPGAPVLSAYVNQEQRFASVEMRSVEEASNAFVFDGLLCRQLALSIRRPNEYNYAEVRFDSFPLDLCNILPLGRWALAMKRA